MEKGIFPLLFIIIVLVIISAKLIREKTTIIILYFRLINPYLKSLELGMFLDSEFCFEY
jgi:hypothetical protein